MSASMATPEAFYAAAPVQRHEVDDATLAVRRFGEGPALVLIHGFPTHGYTWRALLPTLAAQRTCFTIDLPGLGDSGFTRATDFRFTAQARRIAALLPKLGIDRCALLAHDTGATVARLVALAAPARVESLAIVNTEIPGHRPPWIRFHQRMASLPGAEASFGRLLGLRWFQRSGMALGAFYTDRRLFDDPTRIGPYLDPVLASRERMRGMLGYLRGIEWDVVDGLRAGHARITAPVLFLWGEDDVTFPVDLGERMASQLGGPTKFVRIARASLMPHEERPDTVLRELVPFLRAS
jgi:pimeloyl-ACP methyl ester carboxylesterase